MENREDIPRVSVDSAQDWRQIRSNYEKAALSKLEEQVMLRGIMAEKEVIQLHLQQVCIGTLREKTINFFLSSSKGLSPLLNLTFESVGTVLSLWMKTGEVILYFKACLFTLTQKDRDGIV